MQPNISSTCRVHHMYVAVQYVLMMDMDKYGANMNMMDMDTCGGRYGALCTNLIRSLHAGMIERSRMARRKLGYVSELLTAGVGTLTLVYEELVLLCGCLVSSSHLQLDNLELRPSCRCRVLPQHVHSSSIDQLLPQ